MTRTHRSTGVMTLTGVTTRPCRWVARRLTLWVGRCHEQVGRTRAHPARAARLCQPPPFYSPFHGSERRAARASFGGQSLSGAPSPAKYAQSPTPRMQAPLPTPSPPCATLSSSHSALGTSHQAAMPQQYGGLVCNLCMEEMQVRAAHSRRRGASAAAMALLAGSQLSRWRAAAVHSAAALVGRNRTSSRPVTTPSA